MNRLPREAAASSWCGNAISRRYESFSRAAMTSRQYSDPSLLAVSVMLATGVTMQHADTKLRCLLACDDGICRTSIGLRRLSFCERRIKAQRCTATAFDRGRARRTNTERPTDPRRAISGEGPLQWGPCEPGQGGNTAAISVRLFVWGPLTGDRTVGVECQISGVKTPVP